MASGQQIVTNSLTILGINEQGGTPSASDSVDALNELNSMWNAWSVDEGLIYAVLAAQYPLVPFVGAYAIGPGAPGSGFNAPRPQRIYKASIVSAVTFSGTTTSTSQTIPAANTQGLGLGQALIGTGIATGTVITGIIDNTSITISIAATASGTVTLTAKGANRNELKIIEAAAYYAHNDLGALASTPDELYPDYNIDSSGLAKLYLWPVPNFSGGAPMLELDSAATFALWTLVDDYPLTFAYQDAIQYALAMRLIPRFGMIVPQEIAQIVMAVGAKAEQRIREMNALNRQSPPQMMAVPDTSQQKVV